MAGHLLKNCQGYRQDGFPAPRTSSHQGQRAGSVDLGGLKASLLSRGHRHRGFLSRADLRYFHLGKGFPGSPEALPTSSWLFPWQVCLWTRMCCGCEMVGWSLAVPCSEQRPHRACELPWKNQHFISTTVKQPLDLF